MNDTADLAHTRDRIVAETLATPYTSKVTEEFAHLHQSVVMRYAHKPATRADIEHMVTVLRRAADTIERDLHNADALLQVRGER